MENYFIYITIAAITIASPGPGVILTIANSLQYGFRGALLGILGVMFGMLAIAVISATSLAIVLANSAIAFTLVKYLGAMYLIYLGLKMWRSEYTFTSNKNSKKKSSANLFIEGLMITLLNPKPIFFFMSLFPQFINSSESYINQFILLSLIFCMLLVFIHILYAATANLAKAKLSTLTAKKIISRTGGSIFMCFGVGLAASSR